MVLESREDSVKGVEHLPRMRGVVAVDNIRSVMLLCASEAADPLSANLGRMMRRHGTMIWSTSSFTERHPLALVRDVDPYRETYDEP